MKSKKMKNLLKNDREELRVIIEQALLEQQSDSSVLSRPKQDDDSEPWSSEKAQQYSRQVEQRGRRLMNVRFNQYDEVCKTVSKLESGGKKMYKQIAKKIDHAKKVGEQNKDAIVKLRDKIQALASTVQKEKYKRKKLQREVADLEFAVNALGLCMGVAGPGDSPREVYKRVKSIYDHGCKAKIQQRGFNAYIDAKCKEVK